MMQIVNIYTLSVGKFFNGVFVTIVHITTIKMINETVPVHKLGRYAPITAVMGAIGYFLVFNLGLALPHVEYNPSLGQTT